MATNSASAFNYLNELDKQFSPDIGSAISQDVQSLQSLHFRIDNYDLLLPLDTSTEVINKIDFLSDTNFTTMVDGYRQYSWATIDVSRFEKFFI